jgi:exodeoxyribonuclease VII large subunit
MTDKKMTEKTILSVSELNREARVTIEHHFNQVWVMGEMSNFARPRSGHWYFSLKDDKAQVRCAMFANRNRAVAMQPGDGQLVIVRGRVSLYEGRGEFQIIVEHLEPAGEGALRQAFDQLKVKLAAEGLFAEQRKQALPVIPAHVAVITSPTGAAIKDVIAVWQRRFPSMRVTIIPSQVQGDAAEAQLIRGIERAAALQPDVVLLTRGGGSLEDLWSFNLESVARALAACPIPTVSAVGHEIDVTICDFVADVRAPTPSAAAELIAPSAADLLRTFAHHQRQLDLIWHRYHEYLALRVANLRLQLPSPQRVLERANQQVDDAAQRMAQNMSSQLRYQEMRLSALSRQLQALGPDEQLHNAAAVLQSLSGRLRFSLARNLAARSQQLRGLSRMLQSVSPLPTLARGFAIVKDEDGDVLTSVGKVRPGAQTATFLEDGVLISEVKEVQEGVSITD